MAHKEGVFRMLITVSQPVSKAEISAIDGLTDIIIRKMSYATDIDLHTSDTESTKNIFKSRYNVLRCKILDEREPTMTHKFREEILRKESEIMNKVQKLFSEERYWEAHSLLEDLWRASTGETKLFFQGLILIAAAMVHYQRENLEVARRVYHRAIRMIKSTTHWKRVKGNINEEFKYPVEFPVKQGF